MGKIFSAIGKFFVNFGHFFGRMLSPRRFWAVLRKEVHHIKRDPTTLALIFIMPIFMIVLFGFAVSGEIEKVPMVVWDKNMQMDATTPNRERDLDFSTDLVQRFDNSDFFNVIKYVESQEEIEQLMSERKIYLGIVIPEGYSERFYEQEVSNMPDVQVWVDGSDPAIARIAREASHNLIQQFSMSVLDEDALLAGGVNNNIVLNPSFDKRAGAVSTVVHNEAMRAKQFLVPSIIAIIVFSIIIVLTSSTIVREKERGTIEQLIITPMTKTEFMLGKLAPYLVVGLFDIIMIVGLAYFLFSINPVGNLMLFIGLGMLFVLCALGLGIVISTFAANQGQSIMLSIVFIIPSLILCGIITPVMAMPSFVSFLANLFPLTHFLEITRGIIISGLGIEFLMSHVWALVIFAAVVIGLAILKFKKSLE